MRSLLVVAIELKFVEVRVYYQLQVAKQRFVISLINSFVDAVEQALVQLFDGLLVVYLPPGQQQAEEVQLFVGYNLAVEIDEQRLGVY